MRKLNELRKGQGLVEYALILVLIAIVVIVILGILGGQVNNISSRLSPARCNFPHPITATAAPPGAAVFCALPLVVRGNCVSTALAGLGLRGATCQTAPISPDRRRLRGRGTLR
jgi:pilus assembly protein Flp/PilA